MAKPDQGKDLLPPDLTEAILQALRPLAPANAAALKARILERILLDGAPSGSRISLVRGAEGEWTRYVPGVDLKVLHDDGNTRTCLVRMEKGARIPAHSHAANEESFLLEGTCQVSGVVMRPGDYQRASVGSHHAEVFTSTGCVMMLRLGSGPPRKDGA